MEALAARRFAKADDAQIMESVAHFPPRSNRRERHEMEDKAAWNLPLLRLAIPGIELDSANLPHRCKAFHAVDLDIGFTVAKDCH
jgi:hypothetical protein